MEEGGIGFFGQELELGGFCPVIGVVASAAFIGSGEEGAAVDDGMRRGMEGYLGQLGDKRIDLLHMGRCPIVRLAAGAGNP